MRHRNTLAAVIALGAFAALGGACTNAGTPIFILQNQVPEENCYVPADLAGSYNPRGRIDTNADKGYLFTPLVQNVAEKSSTSATQRVAFIQGADIELDFQGGFINTDDLSEEERSTFSRLTRFSKSFSGHIQPGGGLTSFRFTIVPLELLTDFAASRLESDGSQFVELKAKVTIFGNLGGSSSIESPPFTYWIDVCNGCMEQIVGACADLAADFIPLTGGECVDLQDVPVECCTAADGTDVCPAVVPTEE